MVSNVVAAKMYRQFLDMDARAQALTLAALGAVHLEKIEEDKATIAIAENGDGLIIGCMVIARRRAAMELSAANPEGSVS